MLATPLSRALLGFALLALSTRISAQTCFWPDQSIHQLGQPCDPNKTGAQTCCDKTHTCLSSGLCFDSVWNHVIRGSCTDQEFGDGCVSLCMTGYGSYQWGNLRQCNGQIERWICGLDVSDCTMNNTFELSRGYIKDARTGVNNNVLQAGNYTNPAVELAASNTASETLAPSSSAPSLPTGPVTYSPTSTAETCAAAGGVSPTTVGIATGLAVGIPLLLAAGSLAFLLHRTRKQLDAAKSTPWPSPNYDTAAATGYGYPPPQEPVRSDTTSPPVMGYANPPNTLHELPRSPLGPHELPPSENGPHELDYCK
ncbi:hypothetical protein F4780DRAFT_128145 [Xylariomycetidae sp. FL0641]|nr:hypothetical protein F4780DRAFT_128145 [Xylariomycetidae sp. FL0641]